MTGPGRVGLRVTHRLQNVDRVGSGPEKVTRVHLCNHICDVTAFHHIFSAKVSATIAFRCRLASDLQLSRDLATTFVPDYIFDIYLDIYSKSALSKICVDQFKTSSLGRLWQPRLIG